MRARQREREREIFPPLITSFDVFVRSSRCSPCCAQHRRMACCGGGSGDDGERIKLNCIFCKIISKTAPASIIYEARSMSAFGVSAHTFPRRDARRMPNLSLSTTFARRRAFTFRLSRGGIFAMSIS